MKSTHIASHWITAINQQDGSNSTNVLCLLCPHNCVLKEGQRGICRTRENLGGTLYTLAWDNPCSICIDPIEKKPLYHFLPGTKTLSFAIAGCNMRCLNCQNNSISQFSPDNLPSYRMSAGEIVKEAVKHKTESISFTYSEPTVFYEFMLETAKQAHENGIKTVMVSNGYINCKPLQELCQYIDAANIDLKCFDPALHLKLTGSKLQPILETLLVLKEKNVWLEITHLMVPEYSDNLETFAQMCKWLVANGFSKTPLHISRFFPQHKLEHLQAIPLDKLKEAGEIARQSGIENVYLGNV